MRITFDSSEDAAYVYLASIGKGDSIKTYLCDPLEVDGQIHLDFDSSGRLIGIEVLEATRLLHKDLLEMAEIIG